MGAPAAATGGSEPYAPLKVFVSGDGSTQALVQWLPGTQPADTYRIYGIAGGAVELLEELSYTPSTPLVFQTSSVYDTYGVSGVVDGIESLITVPDEICRVVLGPPPHWQFGVTGWCMKLIDSLLPRGVSVMRPPMRI